MVTSWLSAWCDTCWLSRGCVSVLRGPPGPTHISARKPAEEPAAGVVSGELLPTAAACSRLPTPLGSTTGLQWLVLGCLCWYPLLSAHRQPRPDLFGSSEESTSGVMCQTVTCGRSWRRTAPDARASGTKRPLPLRARVNGWSLPLHPYQVVAWAILLTMAGAGFAVFIPLLPGVWRDVAYAVVGGLFLVHLIMHVVATSIDPAEPNVRHKKSYREQVPSFDRSKHAHVIENQYCHLCQVNVNVKAKHCRACNKCVSNFDHHCKWLNNCVGSRNYWWFFSSVVSAVAGLLCLMVVFGYILVQCCVDNRHLRTDPHFADIPDPAVWLLFLPGFAVRANTTVFLLLLVAVLLLNAVSLVMLGQLLIFHMHLLRKHMTTYQYMTQGKDEGAKSTKQKDPSVNMEEGVPQRKDEGARPSDRSGDTPTEVLSCRPTLSRCLKNKVHPGTRGPSSVEGEQCGSRGCGQQGCWARKPGHRTRVTDSGQGPHVVLQLRGPGVAPTPQLEPQLPGGVWPPAGPLPEPKGAKAEGGDAAVGDDKPSSQATGSPAAQGEVRVDLSPVLNLDETVVIPTGEEK
ncbi:putative palmitoyltransferase ZDHHC11B isoform X3 [Tamandua tetradactyla]|uniref:putative palmitoyltransferase ZDHHC11B isoform X3 n=1 Tax=Tamandua tetradactyla TaxID=48850 RepID=UPI00405406EC